jgi:phosphopantetheinyl transferase (holo-ACP synthase)
LHSINIISGGIGKPYIFFKDCLKIYLEELGVDNLFISFSHEGDLLGSYVVAERLNKK